jgi:hypothetical protein
MGIARIYVLSPLLKGFMNEELEVLRQHAESLRLQDKEELSLNDKAELVESLKESDEIALANYISKMPLIPDFSSLIYTLKN